MNIATLPVSWRGLLGAVVSVAVTAIPRPALAQNQAPPAGEVDMFACMLQTLGEPQHASRIGPDEAARYANRVPPALVQFWVEHGRGAYCDGLYWICDPAPFDAVLELIFDGDPEFSPSDMTRWGLFRLRRRESMAPAAAQDERLPAAIDRLQSARKLLA